MSHNQSQNSSLNRKAYSGSSLPLSQLCIEITDCHHSTPNWTDSGRIVARSNNIKKGRFLLNGLSYTDEATYQERIARSKPEPGDLIITREAPMGEVCIIPDGVECCLGQRLVLIKPDHNKISSDYLLYALLSEYVQKQIWQSDKTGSTVSNLRIPVLKSLQIPLVEPKEKISKVLSSIDQKIDANNKINAQLEAMARTLYDYWFVQFDFPDENGKPHKSSGGKMVYNETLKREIPEGWEVKELGKFAHVKKGTLITEKTADTNGDIKVVSAGVNYSYFHNKANYQSNTITVSASGANAGFVNFWREPIFACDCTAVRGRSDAETLIILEFLRMHQDYLYQQARGSAQPHVYPKDIEALRICIPPIRLINEFAEHVISGNQKIEINLYENKQLIKLRDWLLPMLMNGQVKVETSDHADIEAA